MGAAARWCARARAVVLQVAAVRRGATAPAAGAVVAQLQVAAVRRRRGAAAPGGAVVAELQVASVRRETVVSDSDRVWP